LQPLPAMAQMSPLNGMVTGDFNNDGNLDVAICGNDYGNEVSNGRYDAMDGLILLGNGKGNFTAQTILQSGFFVPGDAKALVKLRSTDSTYLLAASQNKGPLKLFQHKKPTQKIIALAPTDKTIFITLNTILFEQLLLHSLPTMESHSKPALSINKSMPWQIFRPLMRNTTNNSRSAGRSGHSGQVAICCNFIIRKVSHQLIDTLTYVFLVFEVIHPIEPLDSQRVHPGQLSPRPFECVRLLHVLPYP